MNATTAPATKTILPADLLPGQNVIVTTTATKTAPAETFDALFRGTASTGLRFKRDGKVITRSLARIARLEEHLTVPPMTHPAPAPEITEETPAPAPVVEETPAPAPAPEVTEETPAAVVVAAAADAGDDLDSMRFAELMVLAKLHKVPGRGVARIDALREGVRKARAEAQETFTRAMA